jgi:lipopolysaccharide export LptBFGC system permease protein LptF
MLIWHKVLLGYLFKHFTWILFSICLLFCLIDYATTFSLSKAATPISELGQRYLRYLLNEASLLVSLSAFLSSFITTYHIVERRELLALAAGGYSLKKTLLPYFIFSLICVTSIFLSQNYLYPYVAHNRVTDKATSMYIDCIELPKSYLICQKAPHTDILHDLYWLHNDKEMDYIDSLIIKDGRAIGRNVFHLKKDDRGKWYTANKFVEKELPLSSISQSLVNSIADPSIQKLSDLIHNIKQRPSKRYEYTAHIVYRAFSLLICPFYILLPFFLFAYFSRSYPWLKIFIGLAASLLLSRPVSETLLNLSVLQSFIPSIALLTIGTLMLIMMSIRYARI